MRVPRLPFVCVSVLLVSAILTRVEISIYPFSSPLLSVCHCLVTHEIKKKNVIILPYTVYITDLQHKTTTNRQTESKVLNIDVNRIIVE